MPAKSLFFIKSCLNFFCVCVFAIWCQYGFQFIEMLPPSPATGDSGCLSRVALLSNSADVCRNCTDGRGTWVISVLLSSGMAPLFWQIASPERLLQPYLVERRGEERKRKRRGRGEVLRQIFDFSGIVGLGVWEITDQTFPPGLFWSVCPCTWSGVCSMWFPWLLKGYFWLMAECLSRVSGSHCTCGAEVLNTQWVLQSYL